MAGLRRPLQPQAGFRRIVRTRRQEGAEAGRRGHVAGPGGGAESVERRRRIGRHAAPFLQQFPERAPGGGRTALGGLPARPRVSSRIGRRSLGRDAGGDLPRRLRAAAGQRLRQPVEGCLRAGRQSFAAGKVEPA